MLNRLPSPIVFDHLGRIPEPAGTGQPAYAVIRDLLDKGRTWVKLSGAYIDTKLGPPDYAETYREAIDTGEVSAETVHDDDHRPAVPRGAAPALR